MVNVICTCNYTMRFIKGQTINSLFCTKCGKAVTIEKGKLEKINNTFIDLEELEKEK